MAWTMLTEGQLGNLIRFLGPREACCAAFTEKLLRKGKAAVPSSTRHRVAIRTNAHGEVDGAILQGRTGLYYPVLDNSAGTVEQSAVDLLRRGTRRIYSVMGRTRDVYALEDAFRRQPAQAVEYHLMVQDAPPPDLPLARLPRDLSIVRSHVADAAALAEIQGMYEQEEVLLPGSTFDAESSLQHLRATLRTQLVVHATSCGEPVGKAGTNARGLFFNQIGGVYTRPALRSRGVGTALMLRLLDLVAAEQKSASLFVKLDNAPALRMYCSLGFRVLDDFRISYYR